MITQTKRAELDEFAEKILSGVNKALRELVENTAAKNGSLIIGDGHGNSKSVPAKELLDTFNK
jgi:hypothetical protein